MWILKRLSFDPSEKLVLHESKLSSVHIFKIGTDIIFGTDFQMRCRLFS